jgi:hypothetical protein
VPTELGLEIGGGLGSDELLGRRRRSGSGVIEHNSEGEVIVPGKRRCSKSSAVAAVRRLLLDRLYRSVVLDDAAEVGESLRVAETQHVVLAHVAMHEPLAMQNL